MFDAGEEMTREEAWVDRFRYYRDPPNRAAIDRWLQLFDEPHRDVACKVLDRVVVVSEREIQQGYLAALGSLPGWMERDEANGGRWFFVGFGRAGESGPAMVRIFREANDLALSRYDRLFCELSDLPSLKLTALDTVVFIDDFSGTGRQVCRMWPVVAEMVASEATCHLILTAATTVAVQAIGSRTDLALHVKMTLEEGDNVFSAANQEFSAEEKEVIRAYGAKADPRTPEGYGKSGLLFVLSHKTPNNSLPILHVNEPHWRGLFPRYLRAA
jgi:hypothetical protein